MAFPYFHGPIYLEIVGTVVRVANRIRGPSDGDTINQTLKRDKKK